MAKAKFILEPFITAENKEESDRYSRLWAEYNQRNRDYAKAHGVVRPNHVVQADYAETLRQSGMPKDFRTMRKVRVER